MTETTMNNAGAKAWSNYWQQGYVTTFATSEEESYSGLVLDYWQRVFSTQDDKSRVVDLAAGNGALISLANDYVRDHRVALDLVAIDAADVTSSKVYQANDRIRLMANTPIEDIPLKSQSVDLIISQFGYEYSDTLAASVEVSRLLKSGGQFRALIHHSASPVTLQSQSAVQQILLCQRSELTDTAAKLIKRLRALKKKKRAAEKDEKARELRELFNRMSNRLLEYGDRLPDSSHVNYFINELGSLFDASKTRTMSVSKKLEILDKMDEDSALYLERMQSMLKAACDDDRIKILCSELISNGLTVKQPVEFESQGDKFAWVIEADK